MAKPLEEWSVDELRAEGVRIIAELSKRAVAPAKKAKADIAKTCEHWVRGYAWDETFTREMVEDEFAVHERKLGQVLADADRNRLVQLWIALREERARQAA
ncbi:MAG TPA: hypothetical protein VE261_05300 [Gaiellaceae bacterium]|jgi:hypothetical protein|nr:hypothetical protein [Gaiellaceae bacterium]